MGRIKTVLFGLGFAVLVAGPATAVPIPITFIDGTWENESTNIDGGISVNNGVDPRLVRWGTGEVMPLVNSGLNYSPAGPIVVESDGTPFLLGEVNHSNEPITDFGDAFVDLRLALSIDGMPIPDEVAEWEVRETQNFPPSGNCQGAFGLPPGAAPPCRDYFRVTPVSGSIDFMFDGQNFRFMLLGFSPVAPEDGPPFDPFLFLGFTNEGILSQTGFLYGKITQPLPEPTTMLLLGAGLLGLGYFTRRRDDEA